MRPSVTETLARSSSTQPQQHSARMRRRGLDDGRSRRHVPLLLLGMGMATVLYSRVFYFADLIVTTRTAEDHASKTVQLRTAKHADERAEVREDVTRVDREGPHQAALQVAADGDSSDADGKPIHEERTIWGRDESKEDAGVDEKIGVVDSGEGGIQESWDDEEKETETLGGMDVEQLEKKDATPDEVRPQTENDNNAGGRDHEEGVGGMAAASSQADLNEGTGGVEARLPVKGVIAKGIEAGWEWGDTGKEKQTSTGDDGEDDLNSKTNG
ncbi:unnamed protein product, partial [Sphacelaria rigidula]